MFHSTHYILSPRIIIIIPPLCKPFLYVTYTLRLCSYLALVAALASEADFVFIPEDPAVPNWPDKLCKKLEQVLSKEPSLEHLVVLLFDDVFNGKRFLDFGFYRIKECRLMQTIQDLSVWLL